MTKKLLHSLAVQLRKDGETIPRIAIKLGVSKASAWSWTKDVDPPIRVAPNPAISRSRRRQKEARVALADEEATQEWQTLRHDPQFMFGLGLYAGEGDKTGSCLGLTNTNPDIVLAVLRFFESIGVERNTIRARITLHLGADESSTRNFWENKLGLERNSFYETCWRRPGVPKHPNGLCYLRVYNMHLKRKVQKWLSLSLSIDPSSSGKDTGLWSQHT